MDAGARPPQALRDAFPDARLLILFFTLGVLAVHALPQLPSVAILAALSIPALLPWRGRWLWAMAVLGVLFTVWRAQLILDQRWPESRHGEDVWVQGTVASLPERGRDAVRFLFESSASDGPQRLRVSWYRTAETIDGGDCWRFKLRMRTPHGSFNPGGFDYEGWLFRQGIGATATVREAARCTPESGYRVLRARQWLVKKFDEWLPGHPAAGLIAALAVGDTSGLTDADWEVFRRTGTSHLVAISGMNIAIAAGFMFFVARWLWSISARLCLLWPAQQAGMVGAALAAFAYALLAGFEVPVQRAVIMLLVVLAAAWMGRLTAPSRVLAVAWLLVLLLDPFAVMSPGLWLSFGAVAAIFYVLTGRLAPPGKWRAFAWLQLALSVVLTPLTLYFFQGTAWIAPLVNLVAVPVFSLLTPVLLLALGAAAAVPSWGVPLLQLVAGILVWVRRGLEWAAGSFQDAWLPASPPMPALLLALFGILLLFVPRGLPLRPLGAFCLLPLLFPPNTAPSSGFELTALDVGQGLSVVVRTSQHALLYDAGPAFEDGFDAGESVVVPYLLKQGVRGLDVLLLSHSDLDHRGGIPAVRTLLKVTRQIGTDQGEPCREGMRWSWDGVDFEMLHPNPAAWSDNNGGCVLKVRAGNYSVLLPADTEAPAEKRLLRDRPADLHATVLVAPHHGSKTSSIDAYVRVVAPEVVLYGAGWRNHFRHPRPEVVARYTEIGATQYITGNSGALTLQVDPLRGVSEVVRWRERAVRFWNAPEE